MQSTTKMIQLYNAKMLMYNKLNRWVQTQLKTYKTSLLMLTYRVYSLILMQCMIPLRKLVLIQRILLSIHHNNSKTNVIRKTALTLIRLKILMTYLAKTKSSPKESQKVVPNYIRKLCVVHISKIISTPKCSSSGPCFPSTAAQVSPLGPSPSTSQSCLPPGAASYPATSGLSFLGTSSWPQDCILASLLSRSRPLFCLQSLIGSTKSLGLLSENTAEVTNLRMMLWPRSDLIIALRFNNIF